MAATGYDVSAGDTWALNELSSAVRQGTGNARANMRAFLNGLYDGDGTLPPARGTVFVAGIGQATTDLSLYQARLQDWYEDSAFWSDLSRFASDWSQEVYGDVRHYAVPGATREARRDLLNEYLQHQSVLAGVAPSSADAARGFLRDFYSPLANAAWRYDAAFGWTDVPVELMQDYVSAQTYAMRSAGNSRFGYAWSPKNLAGIPTLGLQRPDRRCARPARRGDRRLRRRARGCVRRVLVHGEPRRRDRDGRLAHVRDLEAVADRVHLPRADGLAGCTVGAADRRAADERRDRLHGRSPRDRHALVVLADGRALDRPRRSLVVDAGASDRLRREQRELLRPRRDRRLRHDHGRRCRQDIGHPGDHRCGAAAQSSGFAASLRRRRRPRPTSSSRRARHRRRRPSATRSPTSSASGTSAGRRRARSSPSSSRRRSPTPAARPIAGRAARVRRRSAATSTSSRATSSRPSGSSAVVREPGTLALTAVSSAQPRRRAARERHRPYRHGRRARPGGREPALVRPALRAVGAPARVTRARGVATLSVRFSVGGAARLEAARDPARLRAAAHAARRDDARRRPCDEAPTDGHGSRLPRRHVRLQGAGRRGQAGAGPHVPRSSSPSSTPTGGGAR